MVIDHNSSESCPTYMQIKHAHDFGQGQLHSAEKRAWMVAVLTLVVMFAEVIAGLVTGSMALLADGIHMGGHAIALGLAASAYYLSRRYAHDRRLSFGSGKIKDLAAYTSALLLALSSVWLLVESINRLLNPQALLAAEAMIVAIIGLVVNGLSIILLAGGEHHHHEHGHTHSHCHSNNHANEHNHGHDNNMKAALFHVIADAVTSVAAIAGLAAAWLWGWNWLDPVIALVAAILIIRWSWGLMKNTGTILLDAEAPQALRVQVQERLQSVAEVKINDLHLWSVGQGAWTLAASLVSHEHISPTCFKDALKDIEGLHHPMIELHICNSCSSIQPSVTTKGASHVD
ncbi:CDF family Co(II)/Ni(II) efflux transporter DmeF [Thiomicrorhabdus indica]|uniref:CDF family Co(II)/Ni(II) efflux transporter DmeF n=1 Tax=Thiomicrorhabdus indica TaxID=2267253 RepID=UPI00102DC93A|nr:CDF family Co(II)/Ni(II) efflux transporter DmeF [Thiomicrorhabdus indica]